MTDKYGLTDKELTLRLKSLLDKKSLRRVLAEDFTFSSLGMLARIRDGGRVVGIEYRERFGLTTMVAVSSCPNCGGTHPIRKCSPKKERRKLMISGSLRDRATIKAYIEFFKKAIPLTGGENQMSDKTDLTNISHEELISMFRDLEKENERMSMKLTTIWNELAYFWNDIRNLRGDNQTWGQYWEKKKAEALKDKE